MSYIPPPIKSSIPKGGGGKQLGGPIKTKTVTAPKMGPMGRKQQMGAMPRSPGYFRKGGVF